MTEARAGAARAQGPADQSGAETVLTRAIGNLFAVAEAYPELRASENFQTLQRELSSIEDSIQKARRYYNAIVRDLNTACDTFPSNIVAGMFGITKDAYFELDAAEERNVPQVDFSS